MPGKRALALVEFALWVLVASSVVVVASLALGLLVGGDLLAGKYVLFVVGFLLFGLGSLLLQPSRPGSDRETPSPRNHTPRAVPQDVAADGDDSGAADGRDRTPDAGSLRELLGPSATHQHRYEAKLQTIGPLADHDLPYGQRIPRSYKVFATGLVVLAVSYGLEVAGVQPVA